MWYNRNENGLIILIYVQPGAKSTEIVGIHDGALKIRLSAPPADGCANNALQKFLAKQFNVPLRNIKLITGEKNRRKKFHIMNTCVNPEQFMHHNRH